MVNPFLNNLKDNKIAIGMVHLKALPGCKDFSSIHEVIENAVNDAVTLEQAGFQAVMIENFGDTPFYKDNAPKETVAAFTVVANSIREKLKIPIGINVLRNDPFAAIAIANAVKARFIRVNVFISAALTDQGIIEGKAAEIVRYRDNLNPDIAILADVGVKHSYPLTDEKIDLAQEAKEAFFRGRADAVILSGTETGSPPNPVLVKEIRKKVPEINLVLGSGANMKNISEFKKIFNAIIIGTAIKVDNITTNPVDPEKAKDFIKIFNL